MRAVVPGVRILERAWLNDLWEGPELPIQAAKGFTKLKILPRQKTRNPRRSWSRKTKKCENSCPHRRPPLVMLVFVPVTTRLRAPLERTHTMPRFMFLRRGCSASKTQMTPDQMETAMKSWMAWVSNGTEQGWLVDPGSPLSGGGAVVDDDLAVTDGPFAESKELVGGYTIVEAADLAAACELAKETIEIAGGKIEIREFVSFEK